MFEKIMIAIIAVLAWQLLTVLVCILSKENEELTLNFAFGIWGIIIGFGFGWIVRKIRLLACRKYNAYQFFDGKKYYIETYYMTPKTASKFARVYPSRLANVEEPFSIRLAREGKEFKSLPDKYRIITDKKIEQGLPNLHKEYLKNFLKTE